MNSTKFHAEIQAPAYSARMLTPLGLLRNCIIAVNSNAIRTNIELRNEPCEQMFLTYVDRFVKLATQLYRDNNAMIERVTCCAEIAIKICTVSQLCSNRAALYQNHLMDTGQISPFKTQPFIANDVASMIHNLGDYHMSTGLATMTEAANSEIYKMSMDTIGLAMVTYDTKKILNATSARKEDYLAITNAFLQIPDQRRNAPNLPATTMYPCDAKGEYAIRLAVGNSYVQSVNEMPRIGLEGHYTWPDQASVPKMITDIEDWMIANGIVNNPVQRGGRDVPPPTDVINVLMVFIMGQDNFNLLNAVVPDGGVRGEWTQRMRVYLGVLGFDRQDAGDIWTLAMGIENINVVQGFTTKNMHQALNVIAAMYNDRDASLFATLSKAETSKFAATDGGSAAMLVRMFSSYADDEFISIYRAPYGVTKTQQMYGFMINQTEDITFNEVEVKVDGQIEYVKSEYFETYGV